MNYWRISKCCVWSYVNESSAVYYYYSWGMNMKHFMKEKKHLAILHHKVLFNLLSVLGKVALWQINKTAYYQFSWDHYKVFYISKSKDIWLRVLYVTQRDKDNYLVSKMITKLETTSVCVKAWHSLKECLKLAGFHARSSCMFMGLWIQIFVYNMLFISMYSWYSNLLCIWIMILIIHYW